MTQNARVALWIPPVANNTGDAVVATGTPGTGNVIPTIFGAAGGGGGGGTFATDADMAAGTETLEVISPALYRNELVRLLEIITADMTTGAIATVLGGSAALGNKLVKTNGAGFLSTTVLPVIFDGGTF